jgi:recombination protein RecA
LAVGLDIIEKAGSWFSYGGERIGQGKEKVVELLTNNKALEEEIRLKVHEAIRAGKADKIVAVALPEEE